MEAPTPLIPLTPVQSSQIHAIGHDAATQTLAIQFKAKAGPGSVYHYAGVSADVHHAFATAPSIGVFFGSHIKGKFAFKKIEPPKSDPAMVDLGSEKPLGGGSASAVEVCESCQ